MKGFSIRMRSASILLALLFLACATCEVPTDQEVSRLQSEDAQTGLSAFVFFVMMLVIGVVVGTITKYIGLPYTAILVVVGALIGYLTQRHAIHTDMLGIGAQAWMDIEPDLFLTAFLPVLLFASAFVLDWHHVRKLFFEAVMLAGPGVLMGMGLTAVLVKYTFPYDWSWVQCLLFGGVLSATDPVAVAAIMSEAALPLKLQTLVNLEALLNDGAAFVVYTLLKTWAEDKHQNVGDSVRELFHLAAAGPLIGIAFGIAASVVIYVVSSKHSHVTETILTMTTAYGAYVFSDRVASSSGVLAAVFAGLWFAYKGLHHISRAAESPLHTFWEILEDIANTLVFIVAGAIIAGRIYLGSTSSAAGIVGKDWAYGLLLWVYLTVIRIFTFVTLVPILNSRGYTLDWKECAVLSWSGLRGAVGLALGLQIYGDSEIHDESFRVQQFFHIGFVAVLTILIKGTTMRPLLLYLGMTTPAKEKKRWLRHVTRLMEQEAAKIDYDDVIGPHDWQDVEGLVRRHHVHDASLLTILCQCSWVHKDSKGWNQDDAEVPAFEFVLSRANRLQEKRRRLLMAVKEAYSSLFQNHYIGSRHIYALKNSVSPALDRVSEALCDWAELGVSHRMSLVASASAWCFSKSTFAGVFGSKYAGLLFMRAMEDKAVLALSFCNAHEIAGRNLTRLEPDNIRSSISVLDGTPLASEMTSTRESVTSEVLQESSREVSKAFAIVAEIRDGWPEALRAIKTNQLARERLNDQAGFLDDMAAQGLLTKEEAGSLSHLVHRNIASLMSRGPHFHTPSPREMLHENDSFRRLAPATFSTQVWKYVKVRFLGCDREILSQNQQELTPVLLRGVVRLHPIGNDEVEPDQDQESPSDNRVVLGSGHPNSSGAILAWKLLHSEDCPWRAQTVTPCLVAYIPNAILSELVGSVASVRCGVWQSMAAILSIWQDPALLACDYNGHVQVMREATPRIVEAGETVSLDRTIVLLSGQCNKITSQNREGRPTSQPCQLGVTRFASDGVCQLQAITEIKIVAFPSTNTWPVFRPAVAEQDDDVIRQLKSLQQKHIRGLAHGLLIQRKAEDGAKKPRTTNFGRTGNGGLHEEDV